MHKLTFTLKQHTPIIHFQSIQEGATLRATEVKPKLDRFIIEQLAGIKGVNAIKKFKENDEFKKFLAPSNEKISLNYKLRIQAKDLQIQKIEPKTEKGVKNPLYFGNMGDTPPKHFSNCNHIVVTIQTWVPELLNVLSEELICKFFLFHNFGTRQSKGFGSFYPTKYKEKKVDVPPANLLSADPFRLEVQSTSDDEIFATIDYFWKWLKSGINYSSAKIYKDSILKLFVAQTPNRHWEKKRVKEFFLGVTADSDERLFDRAFLGLMDNFTYKWIPPAKRNSGRTYTSIDMTISVSDDSNTISRIPAPIHFIPIKEKDKTVIYILYQNHVQKDLLNRDFKLMFSGVKPIYWKMGDSSPFFEKKITESTNPSLFSKWVMQANTKINSVTDRKTKLKLQNSLDQAKELMSFITSPLYATYISPKYITTPPVNIDLKALLTFTKSKIIDFTVVDFNGNKITKAKFCGNA